MYKRQDGTSVQVVVGEEEGDPQFCVTDLLPHLSTEQMSKVMHQAISAEDLNILVGSRPVADEEGGEMCIRDSSDGLLFSHSAAAGRQYR